MRYLLSPTLEETLVFTEENYKNTLKKPMLTIIGNCRIEYSGRAKSTLDYGERLIIIKSDGAVLVHQNERCEPVNWQPPNTKITFEDKNNEFTINTYHGKPLEKMNIIFQDIQMISCYDLIDNSKIQVIGMERDIVDKIMKEPTLIEDGFRITSKEMQTSSGSIDLFGIDSNCIPVIVEVKRNQATPTAVQQLEAYILDFKNKNKDAMVRGILVALHIPEMVKTLLYDKGFEYRELKMDFILVDEKQRQLNEF